MVMGFFIVIFKVIGTFHFMGFIIFKVIGTTASFQGYWITLIFIFIVARALVPRTTAPSELSFS